MATLAALDIKEQLNPANKFNFYTYGSPRTGNQAFSDYIFSLYPNSSYQRVVHTNDIVPHLPFIAMGFNHAGEEVWYDNDSNVSEYVVCKNQPGSPENESCSDTYYVYDPSAHIVYLGMSVVDQCTTNARLASDWSSLSLSSTSFL